MLTFVDLAKGRAIGFQRSGRCIHSGSSALSTLVEPRRDCRLPHVPVVQDHGDLKKRRTLDRFLDAPTIVIVDEAHHAGATTYDELLDLIEGSSSVQAVVGLTATPFPAGSCVLVLPASVPHRHRGAHCWRARAERHPRPARRHNRRDP